LLQRIIQTKFSVVITTYWNNKSAIISNGTFVLHTYRFFIK
jgi:hypothetical protein